LFSRCERRDRDARDGTDGRVRAAGNESVGSVFLDSVSPFEQIAILIYRA
jgi:hypothetical protein